MNRSEKIPEMAMHEESPVPMTPYRHTQPGTVIRWAFLGGLLPLPLLALLPAGPALWIPLMAGVALLALLMLVLFWSLTLEVTPVHFRFSFGQGLIGRTLPLVRVAACEPVDGIRAWGIHWAGKRGWLYNVSGTRAVAVTLSDGGRLMVGTDEPEALCAAVARAKAAFTAGEGAGPELLA